MLGMRRRLPGLDADLQEAKALAADGRWPARHGQAKALVLRLGEVVIDRRQELLGANAIGRRPLVPLQVTTGQLVARRLHRQRHRAGLQTRMRGGRNERMETSTAPGTAGWTPAPAANRVRAEPDRLRAWAVPEGRPSYSSDDNPEGPPPAAPTDRRRGACWATLPGRGMPALRTVQSRPTRFHAYRHRGCEGRSPRLSEIVGQHAPGGLQGLFSRGGSDEEGDGRRGSFLACCSERFNEPTTATSRCPGSA